MKNTGTTLYLKTKPKTQSQTPENTQEQFTAVASSDEHLTAVNPNNEDNRPSHANDDQDNSEDDEGDEDDDEEEDDDDEEDTEGSLVDFIEHDSNECYLEDKDSLYVEKEKVSRRSRNVVRTCEGDQTSQTNDASDKDSDNEEDEEDDDDDDEDDDDDDDEEEENDDDDDDEEEEDDDEEEKEEEDAGEAKAEHSDAIAEHSEAPALAARLKKLKKRKILDSDDESVIAMGQHAEAVPAAVIEQGCRRSTRSTKGRPPVKYVDKHFAAYMLDDVDIEAVLQDSESDSSEL